LIFASFVTVAHPSENTVKIANAKKILSPLFITLHLLSSSNPSPFIYNERDSDIIILDRPITKIPPLVKKKISLLDGKRDASE